MSSKRFIKQVFSPLPKQPRRKRAANLTFTGCMNSPKKGQNRDNREARIYLNIANVFNLSYSTASEPSGGSIGDDIRDPYKVKRRIPLTNPR